ncbi:MAG: recombinase family protein [Bacillota bacterium]|nr:recombinase family protein [Bacillota bacterium]
MQKAVAYGRYSTNMQREESIQAQMRAIRKYADQNNIFIIKEYVDVAQSGRSDKNRSQFKQMINDAMNKHFDLILVHKLDRFARNKYDSVIHKKNLKNCNVKVISITEYIGEGPISIVMESLLEAMAEFYSLNLKDESLKGLLEDAYKGLFNGGRSPLGYDIVERKYVINEWESGAVRTIFNMYVNAATYQEIIEKLHEKGYKTKSGKPFKNTGLHAILNNERYAGVYVFNKIPRSKDNDNDIRNNRITNSEEKIIRIPGAIPAIITTETFKKAQEVMKKRKQRPRNELKADEQFILTGLITCSCCGNKVYGNSRRNGEGKKYRYYTCKNYHKGGGCSTKPVPKETFENLITNSLIKNIFHPNNAEVLTKRLNEQIKERFTQSFEDEKVIKSQLTQVQNKTKNLLKAIEEGASEFIIIKDRLKELQEEKEKLQLQLDQLQMQLNRKTIDTDTVREFMARGLENLQASNPEACKKLCNEYVEKIIVSQDEVKIYLCFTCVDSNGVGDGT